MPKKNKKTVEETTTVETATEETTEEVAEEVTEVADEKDEKITALEAEVTAQKEKYMRLAAE